MNNIINCQVVSSLKGDLISALSAKISRLEAVVLFGYIVYFLFPRLSFRRLVLNGIYMAQIRTRMHRNYEA